MMDTSTLTLHYYDPLGNYDTAEVITSDETMGVSDNGEDDFGKNWTIELMIDNEYSIQASQGESVFLDETYEFIEDTELWMICGDSTLYTFKPELPEETTPEGGEVTEEEIIDPEEGGEVIEEELPEEEIVEP